VQRHDLDNDFRTRNESPKRITYLIVFDCHVVTLFAFFVRDLHKESRNEGLSYIDKQLLLVTEGDQINLESFHRALKLCSDVLSLLKRPL
jgi:hypothetical protein